jgi:membrane protein insertase, YidC/Oxa1 family, N-terminal domain
MDKNTIIAIVLSTLVIVAGFSIQSIFFPSEPAKKQQQTTLPVPQNNQASNTSTTSSSANQIQSMLETVPAEALVEEKSVVETNLVRVEFTNKGGDIVSYKLKKHVDKNGPIEMAEFTTDDNRAFSLILGDAHGSVVNQLFNVKKISDTEIGFYRTFTVKNNDGTESSFTLVKQYTFLPDDYMFELKVTVDGDPSLAGLKFGNAAYTLRTSPEIGPKWSQKQDQYEYRRFYHLVSGKKKTVNLSAGQTKDVTDKATWAGVAGKYFTLIALPDAPAQSILYSAQASTPDSPESQIFLTRGPISGNKNTDTWRFYVGPRTENFLSKYNVATNNPYKLSNTDLDQIVESSGILAPLEILLKWIMELFYYVIPNWGVSIILLTILMRVIIFPLTKKSSEATLRMQELQPQIQEIQQKHKNNTQKMNEEMAKFYQSVGYNPLSGCLPLLIQFPLIFAMYNLFNNYFEFRGAMFIPGWIPDLSQGDSVWAFPFKLPLLGWSDLRVLPIVYVASQIFSGMVTQTPGNNQQNGTMKFMMFGMPLIFFFLFYNAPSGLILYWTLSNVLMLGQQLLINKMMHAKKASGLKLVKK